MGGEAVSSPVPLYHSLRGIPVMCGNVAWAAEVWGMVPAGIQEIVVHMDSYYDVGAHMGWIIGYRLVGTEWEEAYKRPRGDHMESRETKVIAIPIQDLAPGEWRFAATFTVRGPEFFEEARSETIRIEQGGADQPAITPESNPEGKEKTNPESEARPQ